MIDVGLMVTCLVDLLRPTVGFAAVRLLEAGGCRVSVPSQTCCGQPNYNSGDRASAIEIASANLDRFERFEYVVAPSGSCAGMVKVDYPNLFEPGTEMHARALALAAKTYELTSFLAGVLKLSLPPTICDKIAVYHDSCSCLRSIGVRDQPRQLLAEVDGLELRELGDPGACCGFGGSFAVKYAAVSTEMADQKCEDIQRTGADLLIACDMGCLIQLGGRLKRNGSDIEVRHVAEVLSGLMEAPSIAGD